MAEELFIPSSARQLTGHPARLASQGRRPVEQGQEVLEVETDKAVFNVEAVDSGYIHIGPIRSEM